MSGALSAGMLVAKQLTFMLLPLPNPNPLAGLATDLGMEKRSHFYQSKAANFWMKKKRNFKYNTMKQFKESCREQWKNEVGVLEMRWEPEMGGSSRESCGSHGVEWSLMLVWRMTAFNFLWIRKKEGGGDDRGAMVGWWEASGLT